jgi:hypothetical protein
VSDKVVERPIGRKNWGAEMNILHGGLRRALLVLPVVLVMSGTVAPIAMADVVEPSASFEISAETGAWPVRSGHLWEAPADELMVWENANIVKVDASTADGWNYVRLELNAAGLAPLQVGSYQDVRYRESNPAGPGILLVSNGFGCGTDVAEFTIDKIERDAGGRLTALDADFEQRCGSATAPATRGAVHFQA